MGRGQGEEEDTLVLVPIVSNQYDAKFGGLEDKQVKGFFGCVVGSDSITIKLFKGDRYRAYGRTNRLDTMSAETIAMMCMYLESRAFENRDTFNITDPKLFYNGDPDSATHQIIIGEKIPAV